MSGELFRYPAEWERHAAVWTAWPSHPDLWEEATEAAQEEVLGMCRAIADVDPKTGQPRGEKLQVLAMGERRAEEAEAALAGLGATVWEEPFGDIWLRDTGPIFLERKWAGVEETVAALYRFNGWGEKYVLPHDDTVGSRVAAQAGIRAVRRDWILEGGSLEQDGEGTLLTTRQCLLNPNRNRGWSQEEIAARLRAELGVECILWLEEGLAGDHTDGHIDNLARFLGPGRVVCMEGVGKDDPNRDLFRATWRALERMRDAQGRKLEVVVIPGPGRVNGPEGDPVAASHVNFYVSNTRVVMPVYGTASGEEAARRLQEAVAGREVVACPARHLILGGGSFHCITQQQPG